MNYLNLGCGYRFHHAWTNLDFVSTDPSVIAHNLAQGIPYPDGSFDVVYHSHVLEHFSKSDASMLLKECYRVLRPQGILRVVVPDLEQIARTYLMAMEHADQGNIAWSNHYDWLLLEMYDQVARNYPGGEMLTYLFRSEIPNMDFVVQRSGVEVKTLIETGQARRSQPQTISHSPQRLQQVLHFLRDASYRREVWLKLLLGKEYSALQIGRFRQSGEVHQWMYDRYSLSRLLKDMGFQNVTLQSAVDSKIPDWRSFNLDTEVDGTVYKPDSLFMEAIKP